MSNPSPDKRQSEQIERIKERLEENRREYEQIKKQIAPFIHKRRMTRVVSNGKWRETADLDR